MAEKKDTKDMRENSIEICAKDVPEVFRKGLG